MRELLYDEIRCERPANQDATFVYRVRAWQEKDGTYTQEYGGFPSWHEYSGYDVLDMTNAGVIVMDGVQEMHLRTLLPEDAQAALSERDEALYGRLIRLRNFLDEVIL